MAPFLQRYRLERTLYLATGALVVLGVLSYVASLFRADRVVENLVLPLCMIAAGGAVLILAVAVSAVRIFPRVHPEMSELLDPLGLLSDHPTEYTRARPTPPVSPGV